MPALRRTESPTYAVPYTLSRRLWTARDFRHTSGSARFADHRRPLTGNAFRWCYAVRRSARRRSPGKPWPPDRIEQIRALVVDRGAGEDQPVVLRALERTDRAAQTEQVAVEPQCQIVRVVAAGVRPARDEPPLVVDDLPVQHPGRHRGMVHVLEMRTVGGVLGHDLRVYRLTLGAPGELRVRAVVSSRVGFELRECAEDVRHLPLRLFAFGLMPDEDAVVLLPNRIHPQPQHLVGPVRLVGDVSIGAVGSPAPAVKRALDAVADHGAAVADMCAEVFAVRFHHMQHALLVAVGNQILAEVVQRPDLADREFRRPADHEPTGDFPGERYFHRGASRSRRNDTKYVTVLVSGRGGTGTWLTNSRQSGS